MQFAFQSYDFDIIKNTKKLGENYLAGKITTFVLSVDQECIA